MTFTEMKRWPQGAGKRRSIVLLGLGLGAAVFLAACGLEQPAEPTGMAEPVETTPAATGTEATQGTSETTTESMTETEPASTAPVAGDAWQTVELAPAFPNLTFDRPVQMQHVPIADGDESFSYFVVEQEGRILTFDDPEASQAEVFLDIRDQVDASGQEMGLLGLAFHPDFPENRAFFVNYTRSREGNLQTVIQRFETEHEDRRRAEPQSGEDLLSFSQPYQNHNGGHIAFGPDGYLYIASGDGGSGGDPQGFAQRLDNLLGKILRIDVDRVDPGMNYALPQGNPFLDEDEALPEIYAYGLRNPWRFSFSSIDGRLWTADVGQDRIEEINWITTGGNYGWNRMEGSLCYPGGEDDLSCLEPDFILPIHEYDHSVGRSITGGYVYAGSRIESLQGAYVYGDFISGRIFAMRFDAESMEKTENHLLLETDLRIAAFATSQQEELHVLDYANGRIYELVLGESP